MIPLIPLIPYDTKYIVARVHYIARRFFLLLRAVALILQNRATVMQIASRIEKLLCAIHSAIDPKAFRVNWTNPRRIFDRNRLNILSNRLKRIYVACITRLQRPQSDYAQILFLFLNSVKFFQCSTYARLVMHGFTTCMTVN